MKETTTVECAFAGVRTIKEAFQRAGEENRPAFVPYITAGFPKLDSTVDLLLALQEAGADIIELGMPFSDPLADGPVVQKSSHEALLNGVKTAHCFKFVETARERGLVVPVVLMGYVNPFMSYGERRLAESAKRVGVEGFIVVDVPPDDAKLFTDAFDELGLCFIPLVAPTTTEERMKLLAKLTKGYVYAVSLTGVTGKRTELSAALPEFLARVKSHFGEVPVAVGFGLSSPEHVRKVYELGARGAIVGSAVIEKIRSAGEDKEAQKKALIEYVKFMRS